MNLTTQVPACRQGRAWLIGILAAFLACMLAFQTQSAESAESSDGKCVQIFYDHLPNEPDDTPHKYFGQIHAIYLQNLLGHFPHLQQYLVPIENYRPGLLERCKASIYLGTNFTNNVPDAFREDFLLTKKNVLWAGYKVWSLAPEDLYKLWKVKYLRQTPLDLEKPDERGMPGFYKYYTYKGETFIKWGGWSKDDSKKFLAAFEISQFEFKRDEVEPHVRSWAIHSTNGDEIPYILQNNNHWYIGDSPLSFMTEEDRYLIFADLLFDLLNEEPRYKDHKPALLRIEDIHPSQPLWQLYRATDMLHKKGVPYTIAVIPIFSDPFGNYSNKLDTFIPLTRFPPYTDFLDDARAHGASFVFHGVTHQIAKTANPYNAMSGDDFEFWDIVHNRPTPYDSPDFVVQRIQDGYELLEAAGVQIEAWEVPHYQASPLDYTIFGQLFTWNLGRLVYFPHTKKVGERLPDDHCLNVDGSAGNQERLDYFKGVSVVYPAHLLPSGQFYPYESYGDVYDQRIIPENVGNFQPYQSNQVPAPRTVDDLIRIVRRNRVLRDVWASVFMHPHLLEHTWHEGLGRYRGDTSEIERYINAVLESGYEFISLKDYIKSNTREKRKPTIVEEVAS